MGVIQGIQKYCSLYGLPKTHKRQLVMRPILSATGTYNYAIAKWLDAKLKPLSVNEHTITDIFAFTNEICGVKINPGEILVSYYVSSLFTNVPSDETIDILTHKAFENNWFNDTYDLNLTRTDLVDLLHVATKGQLFQFDGALYEQTDRVAMRSPLGPLLANVFMCSIEESLKGQGKLPEFYPRYVDDTLVRTPDLVAATVFLDTLNHAHSVLASFLGQTIEKFDFKRSQLESRENSIFRPFLEVNKLFATDLFAFGNYPF